MPGRRLYFLHIHPFAFLSPSSLSFAGKLASPSGIRIATRTREEEDAAGGQVPAGLAGQERVRVQVHRRGRHPGGPRRRHGRHHRRDVGHRRRDGARAGEARRPRGDAGAEREGGGGHARAHPVRVPRRRRAGAAPRPQLARLRPRLRRPLPRPRPAAPPPHKQCRQVLARAAGALGGRRGDDLRHQLPRPLPPHQPPPAADGRDRRGHRRAGPRRERLLQRARVVRRRLGRPPGPRHPPQDTLRRHAGLRALQARQRPAHQGARRPAPGGGRERDGELRAPRHRPDAAEPRPGGPRHGSGVRAAVQAVENDPSGCGDHVLRRGAPEAGRRLRPLLRRLQRGPAVAGRRQPRRGRASVAGLRGHDRREPTLQSLCRSNACTGQQLHLIAATTTIIISPPVQSPFSTPINL